MEEGLNTDEYPYNWYTDSLQYLDRFTPEFIGKDNLKFLQIGAFRGDVTLYFLNKVLTGNNCILIDVDTWNDYLNIDGKKSERIYDLKIKPSDKVLKVKSHIDDYFSNNPNEMFDLVYIDGDHKSPQRYKDMTNAWNQLKKNGIIVSYTYFWGNPTYPERTPLVANKRFLEEYAGKYEILVDERQLWIRKSI